MTATPILEFDQGTPRKSLARWHWYWAFGALGLTALYWFDSERFLRQVVAPDNSLNILALADESGWVFTYPSGKQSRDRLVVSQNQPIRLTLSASRGIRGFALKSLGLRQDAVAGRYTSLWFQYATQTEETIRCWPSCDPIAAGHADREPSRHAWRVSVLEAGAFAAWIAEPAVLKAAPEMPAQ